MNTATMSFAAIASPKIALPTLSITRQDANAMMCKLHSPLQNHLLAALPTPEFNRLLPHLELVPMSLGDVIHGFSGSIQHVYFPTTAIVSLVHELQDGATLETASIGNEGVLGISLLLSGENTTDHAIVQNSGFGYRLKAQLLKDEFVRSGLVFQILLRYFQARMTHVAQTAVCNRHHTIEQQLCRFLLLILDRLPSKSIAITQELIASKLGVRRESVTEAVGNLQRTGLIKCSRGHIEVLARTGLEKTSCECYSVVKQEFDRLLTNIPSSISQPN